MSWKPGDRLTHRFNPELGTGRVVAVRARTVDVEFPAVGEALSLAADSPALRPLELRPGSRARLEPGGETVVLESLGDEGRAVLEDGRDVDIEQLWPLGRGDSPIERLAEGDVERVEAVAVRLDALRLAALREADGLGSFLGGRIALFPHQLHVAEQATRRDPIRWLLADEVGLGKTVEAGLILNHLLRTGRADRTLVVAPETLIVQWLGELWRKYHQVFVLLDDQRLADVERDFGAGFSPFDAHRRVVLSRERLERTPRLTQQAVAAGVDLLIVDEAHHLRRPKGHPGNQAWRAVEPIAATGRHVLLLTATPLEDDAFGFFRLLQLLRPASFPEDGDVGRRLDSGEALPACTSATRRVDIGGLPPRRPEPQDLSQRAWAALAAAERAMRAGDVGDAAKRNRTLRRIRRALASGPALEAVLPPRDEASRAIARAATDDDPRIDWLARRVGDWARAGDKTLVFVAHRETLEVLRAELSRRAQLRTGVFHEDLSTGQRDIEVAQFRLPAGPSLLISTECGGEGRNFEFCTRLVLWDLPWNPMTVEQRIGRLDRIGRTQPVQIVYFRPPGGLGAAIATLYERLGLFEAPLGGLERELADVETAIEDLALTDAESFDEAAIHALVDPAHEAADRVRAAAFHELHRDRYRPELGPGILERVPGDLEELTRDVVLGVADRLDMKVESHRNGRRHSIELGTRARVTGLPGIPEGSTFLGSFIREEAVADERIDFFGSGHPLVEGVLAHLEESALGRVGVLRVRAPAGVAEGVGLAAVRRGDDGPQATVVDLAGHPRPEWAATITDGPLLARRVKPEAVTGQPGWARLVRSLAPALESDGRPELVAVIIVDPPASPATTRG